MGFSIIILIASFLIVKRWYDNDQFAKQQEKEKMRRIEETRQNGKCYLFECFSSFPPTSLHPRYENGKKYAFVFGYDSDAEYISKKYSNYLRCLGKISIKEADLYNQVILN